MAVEAKQILKVEEITVLADKGYYTGECLEKCEQNNITAIISKQKAPSSTGNENYIMDKFKYDSAKDQYICPQGKILFNVSKMMQKASSIVVKPAKRAFIRITAQKTNVVGK